MILKNQKTWWSFLHLDGGLGAVVWYGFETSCGVVVVDFTASDRLWDHMLQQGARKSTSKYLPTGPFLDLPTITNFYQLAIYEIWVCCVLDFVGSFFSSSVFLHVLLFKKSKTCFFSTYFDHEVRITNFYQLLPTELVTFLRWILQWAGKSPTFGTRHVLNLKSKNTVNIVTHIKWLSALADDLSWDFHPLAGNLQKWLKMASKEGFLIKKENFDQKGVEPNLIRLLQSSSISLKITGLEALGSNHK